LPRSRGPQGSSSTDAYRLPRSRATPPTPVPRSRCCVRAPSQIAHHQ
jgi:hypothetical protein